MQYKKRRGCKYVFPLFQAQKAQYACRLLYQVLYSNAYLKRSAKNVKNLKLKIMSFGLGINGALGGAAQGASIGSAIPGLGTALAELS